MRPRMARVCDRMSWPKTRAVPAEGGWNPRRVWSSVVLPAPIGPRRPMQRPVREAFNPLRISRPPNLTSRPWSSMTGVRGSDIRGSTVWVVLEKVWAKGPWRLGMTIRHGPKGTLVGLRLLLGGLGCVLRVVHHPGQSAHAGERAEVQAQGVLVAAGEDDPVGLGVGVVERRTLRH